MSSFKYTAGLNNVGSYQVSGKPFVTTFQVAADGGTPTKIEFPYVTKEIVVAYHSDGEDKHAKIAFSEEGLSGDEYFQISSTKNAGSFTFNVKATELYVISNDSNTYNISIFASLTNLSPARINNLSGSDGIVGNNWSGSAGVG